MSAARIVLSEYSTYGDTGLALHCPGCGNPNLHQTAIEVYARREDAVTKLVMVDAITGTTVMVPDDCGANPSDRRQGLVVRFRCELCPAVPELGLIQHKGTTYVHWIWPPAAFLGLGAKFKLRGFLPRNWWRRS